MKDFKQNNNKYIYIYIRKAKPEQMLKNLFVAMVFKKENFAGRGITLYE